MRARGFTHTHCHSKLSEFDRYMKSKRVLENCLKIHSMLRFYVFLNSKQKRREKDAKFEIYHSKNYPSCFNISERIHLI